MVMELFLQISEMETLHLFFSHVCLNLAVFSKPHHHFSVFFTSSFYLRIPGKNVVLYDMGVYGS